MLSPKIRLKIMKTYNIDITINKSKKNNNPSIFGSASAYIDNLILTNLKKTTPYLFGRNEPSSKTIIIDDSFGSLFLVRRQLSLTTSLSLRLLHIFLARTVVIRMTSCSMMELQ